MRGLRAGCVMATEARREQAVMGIAMHGGCCTGHDGHRGAALSRQEMMGTAGARCWAPPGAGSRGWSSADGWR